MRRIGIALGVCLAVAAVALIALPYYPTASAAPPAQAGDDPFFLPQDAVNIEQAYVKVAPSGAVHVAYSSYTGGPAHYAYCPSDCSTYVNWGYLEFTAGSEYLRAMTIDLTSDGKPRILWLHSSLFGDNDYYLYGECDANCLTSSNWTVARLPFDPNVYQPDHSRYFALDPQGRPRFIYTDYQDGTYYAYCDTNCTTPANWSQTLVVPASLYKVTLVFTSDGLPRMTYYVTSNDANVWYVECNTNCADADNWYAVGVFSNHGNTDFSLVLTDNDQPRMAYYSGYVGENNPLNYLLFYGVCNTNCLDAANWTSTQVPLNPRYGEDVELTLDSGGNPHLAYNINTQPYALGYAACLGNCDTTTPTWASTILETANDLNQSDPVPPIPGCSIQSWYPGANPSIALDANDAPHIVYDAEHLQGGTCEVRTDIYLARFITLADDGATPTPTAAVTPSAPTLTPTATVTPGGPTLTPTVTPGGPTLTPTPTATPFPENWLRLYLPLTQR